jgi:hypothetical protein
MEIITRKQAFARGLVRFYTGRPCKNGHDAERYTSVGNCVKCASKPWVLRGGPLPINSPAALRFLVELPRDATDEQRAEFVTWVQHSCVPAFFKQFGLELGPVQFSPEYLARVKSTA